MYRRPPGSYPGDRRGEGIRGAPRLKGEDQMKKLFLGMLLIAVVVSAQQPKIAATYRNDPQKAAEILKAPACVPQANRGYGCTVRVRITGENKRVLKLKTTATFDDGSQRYLKGTFERKDPNGKDLGPFRVGQVLEHVGFFGFGHADANNKERNLTAIYAEVDEID